MTCLRMRCQHSHDGNKSALPTMLWVHHPPAVDMHPTKMLDEILYLESEVDPSRSGPCKFSLKRIAWSHTSPRTSSHSIC